MDEIQAHKQDEAAAMGESLMALLGEMYCCEPTESAIKKGVYKHTECGAWIHFTEKGVKVGSIVEGSDIGTDEFDIGYNGDDEQFRKAYFEALTEIEYQASVLYQEANAWQDEETGGEA